VAPQKLPEERLTILEERMETARTTVAEIRGDIKALPKLLRKQVVIAMRRQRKEIQADTEAAIRACREAQAPKLSPPKPDAAPWDLSWIKPVLVGLAVIGSLVGGAVAAIRGQPIAPLTLSAPADNPADVGGKP
jgi:hypothetical protein